MMTALSASAEKDTEPARAEATAASAEAAQSGGPAGIIAAGWLGHELLSHPANAGVRTLAMRRAQQTYGNRFVQRVMAKAATGPGPSRVIQRQCACGGTCADCPSGEADSAVAATGDSTETTSPAANLNRLIQTKAAAFGAPEAPANVDLFPPGGEPLDRQTRGYMESHIGVDLGAVRVHTDSRAAVAASDLNAEAYTSGRDIYFGAGRYQPEAPDGKELLAHELTHTIQQANNPPAVQGKLRVSQPGDPDERQADEVAGAVAAGRPAPWVAPAGRAPAIARQPESATPTPAPAASVTPPSPPSPGAPPVDANPVNTAVSDILDDLSGITTGFASARILKRFQGKDAGTVRAIIQGLKNRAAEDGESAASVIPWMFNKLDAEDNRTLRRLLISLGVTDDVGDIVAAQVKKSLTGLWISESDAQDILAALTEFSGPGLDGVLVKVQHQLNKTDDAFPATLLGATTMDRVVSERLRQHLFNAGGPRSLSIATDWTAAKILDLLKGYTSHADSSAIAWNFETTPVAVRQFVLNKLDPQTRKAWPGPPALSAQDALMKYLDQSDYEKIQTMGGVTLNTYVDRKSTGQAFLSGAEWIAVVLSWTACGVIGIATGLLSAAWDLLKGIWDIVVVAKHIVMVILYLLSLGAVGSEDWLAVKEFFTGLKSLGHPTQIWDTYWANVKLEFKTIEGPLAQCRMAEYIVRKVVSGVVSILLIFVAGVGVAKAIVSGVRMLAEFALLIRDVEILDALAEVASGARKSLRTFVKATTEVAEALVKALRNPIKTLIAARQKINLILLAAKDQGAYKTLRGIIGELTDAEVKKWQQERNAWRELGERQAARHAEVAEDASNIAENLGDNEVPDKGQGAVDEIDGKAKALDGEAQSLEDDVKGQGKEPPASTAAADVAKLVEDDVKVTQEATGEVHEFKYLSDGRIIRCSDECLELIDSIIKRSANVPPEAGSEAASIRQATENLAKEYRGLAEQKSPSPEQLARKSQIKSEVEGLEQKMANLESKVGAGVLPADAEPVEGFAPGSDGHRAIRWKEYQERGGEWKYDRWLKTYENNMVRAREAHAAVDAFQKELGWGKREVTVEVDGETRRLDIADVTTRRAVEYKRGYQSLTKDNLSELERDAKLVNQEKWDIAWVFEEKPSEPLLDELEKAGIHPIIR